MSTRSYGPIAVLVTASCSVSYQPSHFLQFALPHRLAKTSDSGAAPSLEARFEARIDALEIKQAKNLEALAIKHAKDLKALEFKHEALEIKQAKNLEALAIKHAKDLKALEFKHEALEIKHAKDLEALEFLKTELETLKTEHAALHRCFEVEVIDGGSSAKLHVKDECELNVHGDHTKKAIIPSRGAISS